MVDHQQLPSPEQLPVSQQQSQLSPPPDYEDLVRSASISPALQNSSSLTSTPHSYTASTSFLEVLASRSATNLYTPYQFKKILESGGEVTTGSAPSFNTYSESQISSQASLQASTAESYRRGVPGSPPPYISRLPPEIGGPSAGPGGSRVPVRPAVSLDISAPSQLPDNTSCWTVFKAMFCCVGVERQQTDEYAQMIQERQRRQQEFYEEAGISPEEGGNINITNISAEPAQTDRSQ